MKKRIVLIALGVILLLAVLFVPTPVGPYKDGGTKVYSAFTYKLVEWNRIVDGDIHKATKLYWFPDNFKSIDELWVYEEPNVVHKFVATVLELNENSALVEPVEGEWERLSCDKISLNIAQLTPIGARVGSDVEIYYTGGIMESYPAQIHVVGWKPAKDLSHRPYTEQWLDKETAQKYDTVSDSHYVITEIYSNCFFADAVIPMPYKVKINGRIGEEWCVGDQVHCTYENIYYDHENGRQEVDLISIEASDWEPEPGMAYKPVIYLYPEEKTEVSVLLELDGRLTCTYPAYKGDWHVTAEPNGTLTDARGQTYNYLYWEGETAAQWDMTEGFCVKGADTSVFLEQALARLGLTRREANEFIVYWLPLMEQNPYNIISFQTEAYTDSAPLQIDPAPDTLIRVFMAWQAAESFVELPGQLLTAPERTGFTVVEWGGTEVK